MEIKIGDVSNKELKFIPTKSNSLDKYLEKIDFIEEIEITQYFDKEYKYRKITNTNNKIYTKSLKYDSITRIHEIDENTYLKYIKDLNPIIKKRMCYKDNNFIVDVDIFSEPQDFIMIEISGKNLTDYKAPKGFIDVTNNNLYQNKNIFNNSIKKSNIVIEGGDGVGKTSVIEELLNQGFICHDRCTKCISKNMFFDIDVKARATNCYNYIKESKNVFIILLNNNKHEIERRIKARADFIKLSDFDKQAFEYGQLYTQTIEYMKEHNMITQNLLACDCTNLNKEEQLYKVIKMIEDYNNIVSILK